MTTWGRQSLNVCLYLCSMFFDHFLVSGRLTNRMMLCNGWGCWSMTRFSFIIDTNAFTLSLDCYCRTSTPLLHKTSFPRVCVLALHDTGDSFKLCNLWVQFAQLWQAGILQRRPKYDPVPKTCAEICTHSFFNNEINAQSWTFYFFLLLLLNVLFLSMLNGHSVLFRDH